MTRLIVFLMCVFAVGCAGAPPRPPSATVPEASVTVPALEAPIVIAQGGAALVELDHVTTEAPTGEWMGRAVPFFRLPTGNRVAALLGVDLENPPGIQSFTVRFAEGDEKKIPVEVVGRAFGVQTLTLPKEKVTLGPKTLRRVLAEQEAVARLLERRTPGRLWAGSFEVPVEGKIVGSFGMKRIINGEPRKPHSGEDISAPPGAPVVASNDGVVAAVRDLFFSGNSIFIDHGLGVYTMYFHLSRADVRPGQKVVKGQRIGAVGATGRASGPHLHWGVSIDGSRTDPFVLSRLALP